MTEIHTAEALLAALKKSAKTTLTASELQQQKISFIMGSLSDDSTVTREQVSHVLADQTGK